MRAMRGHGEFPLPDVGVRVQCLLALLHGPGETEAESVRAMAGAQWIVDDLFNEIRGVRLNLIALGKALTGSK